MELTGSMQTFLIIICAILLCPRHMNVTYAVQMAMNEIPQVYRTEAAHPHTTPEHHIFILPLLPSITHKSENTARPIESLSGIAAVPCTILDICTCKNRDSTLHL